MTTPNADPVDPNNNPGGNVDPEPGKTETVSYESHQKLLGEKKKLSERLKANESELSEIKKMIADKEEAALKDNNQWKEAYGKAKEDLEVATSRLQQNETERLNAKKLNSFFDAIGSRIDSKYWNLIDIDQIAMDGENIDEFSVSKYVESFKNEFPEVIKPKETRGMPNAGAPAANSGGLSYEEWLKLPAQEKEARMSEVK